MTVYVAPEVAGVIALHPYLNDASFRRSPIREQIAQQAETVLAGHKAGGARIAMQIFSWWPGARGKTLEEVMNGRFSQDDAALTMSREYGFRDWADVGALGDLATDPAFDAALDALLSSDVRSLQSHLAHAPGLATAHTRYGHRSTLLHYLGANGVESHRQVTPLAAPALAQALIAVGADRMAIAGMYGGGQTAHALASSSAHPVGAGIASQLLRVLRGDEPRGQAAPHL